MITRFASLSSRMAAVSVFLFAIVACGGGGGGGNDKGGFIPDTGVGAGGEYKLIPTITDAAGNETATVTAATPVFLTVVVKKRGSGNRKSGVLVKAVTDSGGTVAQILPASGTATSDANGEAHFQIAVGEGRGGDLVLISAGSDEGESLAEIGIQVGQTGLRLGHFDDGVFMEGAIGVSDAELSVGGSAALSFAVVDENDELAITPDRIFLKSGCALSGQAALPDSVTTTNGRASASYTDRGCGGEDTITASLESNGASALGFIDLAEPEADVVEFISANPRNIALKGTAGNGRPETATVVFGVYAGTQQTVQDPNDPEAQPGTPLAGVPVRFSLSSDVGGIELQSYSAITGSDGRVSTVVKSGNVAATVRVIATADLSDGGTVFTSSDAIVISTGLPDQNSISLSASELTVEGAMDRDGEYSCLTVRMADRFNNPVIDGTEALFTTEYGAIDESCITGQRQGTLYLSKCSGEPGFGQTPNSGECSVAWVSQNPREPGLSENQGLVRNILDYTKCDDGLGNGHNGTRGACPVDLGPVRGGRTTILVTAQGEEYFVDANGNGLYDRGEEFTNLPEAFVDHNEDRVYTPTVGANCPTNPNDPDGSRCAAAGAEETFTDYNNNGRYDLNVDPNTGQGVYNGTLCPEEGDGIWCSRDLVNVRDDIVLVMGSSGGIPFDIVLANARTGRVVTTTQEGDQFMAYVADFFNNAPAPGSNVKVAVTAPCSLLSESDFVVPDSNLPGAYGVPIVTGGDNSGGAGTVTVTLSDEAGNTLHSETFGCQTQFVDPNGPQVSPNP